MMDEDEPVLGQTKGTEISWNAGKNITVKVGGGERGAGAMPVLYLGK